MLARLLACGHREAMLSLYHTFPSHHPIGHCSQKIVHVLMNKLCLYFKYHIGSTSLDEGAHCICGCSQRMDETTFQDCVVYTLVTAQQTLLEVQLCQKCPHILQCFIGPDGWHLGLCNLNNSVVFTHDLLDDYMANFTSSETPFLAWVSAMQKRYTRQGSLLPFTHEAVFHNAWFSYSSLQQLEGDMKCPKCGPAPKDVIWDSVLLSFHCRHLDRKSVV